MTVTEMLKGLTPVHASNHATAREAVVLYGNDWNHLTRTLSQTGVAEIAETCINAHQALVDALEAAQCELKLISYGYETDELGKQMSAALALARGESSDHCLCEFATAWDGKTHDRRCHKAVQP